MSMIIARNLVKEFGQGEKKVIALNHVDLDVSRGEYLAIMGRSGAGKSTLLYQLSLLDEPTEGSVLIDGKNVSALSNEQKTQFRLAKLGYVFQDYALLPELTALENVAVPLLMQGLSKERAYKKSVTALGKVGLEDRHGNVPSALSGGEQQRVSVARAIAHDPEILFADEPTANLDTESAERVLDIFDELHHRGQTIVMVTHELEYGKRAERIIRLEDGAIVSERKQ